MWDVGLSRLAARGLAVRRSVRPRGPPGTPAPFRVVPELGQRTRSTWTRERDRFRNSVATKTSPKDHVSSTDRGHRGATSAFRKNYECTSRDRKGRRSRWWRSGRYRSAGNIMLCSAASSRTVYDRSRDRRLGEGTGKGPTRVEERGRYPPRRPLRRWRGRLSL